MIPHADAGDVAQLHLPLKKSAESSAFKGSAVGKSVPWTVASSLHHDPLL
jgi:hypothetical protein